MIGANKSGRKAPKKPIWLEFLGDAWHHMYCFHCCHCWFFQKLSNFRVFLQLLFFLLSDSMKDPITILIISCFLICYISLFSLRLCMQGGDVAAVWCNSLCSQHAVRLCMPPCNIKQDTWQVLRVYGTLQLPGSYNPMLLRLSSFVYKYGTFPLID